MNSIDPVETSRIELDELLHDKPHLKKYQDKINTLMSKSVGGIQKHLIIYGILMESRLEELKASAKDIADICLSVSKQIEGFNSSYLKNKPRQ